MILVRCGHHVRVVGMLQVLQALKVVCILASTTPYTRIPRHSSMSGYYPGIDRSQRRRGDDRRDPPYSRRADRGREDIPWRGGAGREDERDRRYDRDRNPRFRSRSRERQPEPLRYQRYVRDDSRDRRGPSPPAARYRDGGLSSTEQRRRSPSRDSIQRRDVRSRYEGAWDTRERRNPESRAASRPRTYSGSQSGATGELVNGLVTCSNMADPARHVVSRAS